MRYCLFINLSTLLLVLAGCSAHYPINEPLEAVNPTDGYRNLGRDSATGSESLYVGLAFSGGGTRAAAFAYGVLEALRDTNIEWEGNQTSLVDEIDNISSVSGGSFPAAYFGLFGDRIFDDFEDKFLYKNVQNNLGWRVGKPTSWFKLGSSSYDRTELAADYYDEILFEGKTFADILDANGPIIQINSTEIGIGKQFTFIQGFFDLICSDISSFPVSRAVAASSAVPFVFTPVRLNNYAGTCNYQLPDWATAALADPDTTSRRYYLASNLTRLMDSDNFTYLNLLDGGLSDNLGVRPIINRLSFLEDAWSAAVETQYTEVRRILIIIVNAQAEQRANINISDGSIPIMDLMDRVTSIPSENYNYETLYTLRDMLQNIDIDIAKERCQYKKSRGEDLEGCDDLKYYIVEVAFNQLEDEKKRNELNNLPTSFSLEPEQIDDVRDAAKKLLLGSEEFQRFLNELN